MMYSATETSLKAFLAQPNTKLAWLIDLSREQIWVWQGDDLPSIYSQAQLLPTLGNLPGLTV